MCKVGVTCTIYDVPGIVARDRQQTLAISWILGALCSSPIISNAYATSKCVTCIKYTNYSFYVCDLEENGVIECAAYSHLKEG